MDGFAKKSLTKGLLVTIFSIIAAAEFTTSGLAGEVTWDIDTEYSGSVNIPIPIPKDFILPLDLTVTASGVVKAISPTGITRVHDVPDIGSGMFSHTFIFDEIGDYQIEETYTFVVTFPPPIGLSKSFTRSDIWTYPNSTPTLAIFRLEDMYLDSYVYDVSPSDTLAIKSITPSVSRPGDTGRIEIITLRSISAGETIQVLITLSGKWHKISSLTPIADKEPPVITHTRVMSIKAGSPITAKVTDNLKVESVSLYFKDVLGTDFQPINMLPSGGQDNYQAYIPTNAYEGTAQYYLKAKDVSGNETIHPLNPYDIFVKAIIGDVNDDGEVNDADATLVLQNAVGLINFTPQQKLRGDVSGNGTGSSYDAGLILQYAMGLIDKFPVQGGGLATLSDFITASAVEISIPHVTGLPGDNIIVPINTTYVGGLGIIGIDINLMYDPSILTAIKAIIEGTISSGCLAAANITNGQITIGIATSNNLTGEGPFVKVEFNVPGTANGGQTTSLTLSNASLNEGGVSADITHGLFLVLKQMSIELHKGWNLISICLDMEDNALLSVLKPVEGLFKAVWAYDANPGWKRYIHGGPGSLNNLETIVPGKGYLIYMTADGTLTITGKLLSNTAISLSAGRNLVGYNSLTPRPPANALQSLPEGTSIWAYDNITGIWMSYVVGDPDFLNNLNQLEPGRGYYLYTTRNIEWVISP